MTPVELSNLLRRRIIADLHLGRLKPGARLPSLREVARELNVSIRTAARAYAELQREGLVTVRGRSGIYLVLPHAVEIELEEPFDWYAEMLRDAWARRLSVAAVNGVLQELVANPLRVACVESTVDHMEAFCAELETDFALKSTSVQLTPEGARVGEDVMTLYDAMAGADFVVTTAFHATEVRVAADMLRKPVVIASVNDTLVNAVERELQNGPVTIFAEDNGFVERLRTYLVERFQNGSNMKVEAISNLLDNPELSNGTTALYTRAARRRLNEEQYHLLPPPIPFLSSTTARKIVQCMLAVHSKRPLRAA
jgi:DNA-binding transcriptional regulator YhcF (GntR family)